MKKIIAFILAAAMCLSLTACQSGGSAAETRRFIQGELSQEQLAQASQGESQYLSWFGGYVGERVEGASKNWLYEAYESNPLMLDSIRQKGLTDIDQKLSFWYGMFAPGILRGAAGCYAMEKDPVLYEKMERIVQESLDCWDAYGSVEYDSEGEEFPLINPSWLNGVMAWYEASDSENALALAVKMGDYYIEKAESRGISDTMPMIGLAQLCKATEEQRFYNLLDQYELAWTWTGGNYVAEAENGTEYCDLSRNNWENVFEVEALGPLYDVRQDQSYLDALEWMWESIVLTDRRSSGANTTQEGAAGTPYADGSAETCGNVSYMALTSEYAMRSKNSYAIDELELTFFNAVLGSQAATGRWWTYDTPQEGYRVAAIDELTWQSAQGSPEFSCCMSNSALGVSTLSKWATFRDASGIYVNYYGESEFVTATPGGKELILTQKTAYPSDGAVEITLHLPESEEFTLHLRTPVWSENGAVKVNGTELDAPVPGNYYSVTNTWKDGDTIELSLDMSPHYWAAGEGHSGEVSVYSGPLLLALDQRFNSGWDGSRQPIVLNGITLEPMASETYPETLALFKATDGAGRVFYLSDFSTAGQSGTYYTTWFQNKELANQPLQRNRCAWNQRL